MLNVGGDQGYCTPFARRQSAASASAWRLCSPSRPSASCSIRAAALELQHSEPQILERINGFFGYDAVGHLRLIQAPLPRRIAPPPPPAKRSVSDAGETEIAQTVRDIRDPGLRAALRSLGRTLKG